MDEDEGFVFVSMFFSHYFSLHSSFRSSDALFSSILVDDYMVDLVDNTHLLFLLLLLPFKYILLLSMSLTRMHVYSWISIPDNE